MARVLIVGCGCRGRALAGRLVSEGHAVRGTTRDTGAAAAAIASAGAQVWVGDPARLATLTRALEAVTVVCWLLASARGDAAQVAALHDERLRSYLHEMVDTTVRGFVYEAVGSVERGVLARGREIAEAARATWELPVVMLEADPGDVPGWVAAARDSVSALLVARSGRVSSGLG